MSQQTLRTAVYSQEFNKVNSVVQWKFRANLGQFWGRVRPHWKQIDVKRCCIESTSSTKFKQRFSHFLASFRATIESVSQQTLRTAVYSQEFNKVNSVVQWKFRANLGQFWGRVRPHWKQIDVKRWGFIIPLSWNLQGLLHKVNEKRLKFLAIRENFGIFWLLPAWSYKVLQKNFTSIYQGKIDEQY